MPRSSIFSPDEAEKLRYKRAPHGGSGSDASRRYARERIPGVWYSGVPSVGRLARARELSRHVGQNVTHHGERGDILAKILGIDFVERVGFGVVPVEVMRSGRSFRKSRNTFADDGRDIGSAAAG